VRKCLKAEANLPRPDNRVSLVTGGIYTPSTTVLESEQLIPTLDITLI